MKAIRPDNRRGITLLFVISMIVLFLLMGTTFVIISNDFLKGAKKRNRLRVKFDDSRQLIEQALFDLVRGPDLDNINSPLRTHSILGDMYGYGMRAVVKNAQMNQSQQFIRLELQRSVNDPDALGEMILDGQRLSFDPNDPVHIDAAPGRFDGLLLTFVTGTASGMTTRIIAHQVSGDSSAGFTHSFIVMPVWSNSALTPDNISFELATVDGSSNIPDTVIINGRPFSGSGAGMYDPNTDYDKAALAGSGGTPAAFQPNQVGRTRQQLISTNGYLARLATTGGLPTALANHASVNESYDTFDFQNLFLGGTRLEGNTLSVIPSFYRQKLISQMGGPGGRADFRAFPNQAAPNVDNTNDGIADGFWMDIGMPVQTGPDGRRYKPLVSYFVADMDGKLNVNTHGNLSQVAANNRFKTDLPVQTPIASYGQGYGPPEIDLSPVFGAVDSQYLMEGNGNGFFGRYGVDGVAGFLTRDLWSAYKLSGYPQAAFGANPSGLVGNHFQSSPMDIFGRLAYGFPYVSDYVYNNFWIGMPVADIQTSTLADEITNSPYEMNVTPLAYIGAGDDAPFTLAEMQRVLRPADRDTFMLPTRLESIAINTWSNPNNRYSATTDSYEVPTTFEPTLSGKLFEILSRPNAGGGTVGIPLPPGPDRDELIRANIVNFIPNSSLPDGNFRRDMLAPDLRRGLPMNINRPFGNGFDNNNNFVTDEMGETGETLAHPNATGGTYAVNFDQDNDGYIDNNESYLARQIFARQLYVMVLLTTQWVDRNGDGNVNFGDWYDFDASGAVDQNDLIAYRRVVAQWAINVVDFRDPDAIMTAFEVDLNPWNGWNVDGDLTTQEATNDRHVYWGTERPELVIAETLGTHDRRTEDTASDESGEATDDDPPDLDFDSHLLPVASAFFELYNPWLMNANNQVYPAELYGTSGGRTGVDLQRLAPGDSPVWRMVATIGKDRALDPDDTANNGNGGAPTEWRRIYFTKPGVQLINELPDWTYYPPASVSVNPLEPGRYAVIGSATSEVGNEYTTYFGRRTTANAGNLELDETRRIVLDPAGEAIRLYQWDNGAMDFVETTRNNVISIPICRYNLNDDVRSFGLSDPLLGYVGLMRNDGLPIEVRPLEDGFGIFNGVDPNDPTPYYVDVPAGRQLEGTYPDDEYNQFLRHSGLHSAYNTVHLQRLANPLLPYDPDTNPYRTVDSNSVDLFCFNGVDRRDDPFNISPEEMRFGTFERRSSTNPLIPGSQPGQNVPNSRFRMLWKTDLDGKNPQNDSDSPNLAQIDQHNLSRNLANSLGLLNEAYRNPSQIGVDPEHPFAWLTWNNRPYTSALELANVPHTSSYWLSCKFDVADEQRDVYQPDLDQLVNGRPMGSLITGGRHYSGRYAHLLNFYSDQSKNGMEPDTPWLHRIFDYLEVPSRFSGTETYVNPSTFTGNLYTMYDGFAPPFDTISNYRNPGKININTLTDQRVWQALMGPIYGTAGVTFDAWKMSRKGNSPVSDYGNPYRASNAFNLVPTQTLVVNPADCGLFRRDPAAIGGGLGTPADPMLENDANDPLETTKRNAYFRNDMRQRLGNLVTTRSSVFAIWITVGYFEVDDTGIPIVEVGADIGETKRGRGFFILDRSIPVAFEPGKNHNVERAIRVSSFIE